MHAAHSNQITPRKFIFKGNMCEWNGIWLTPIGFSLWRGMASSGDGGRGGASCTAVVQTTNSNETSVFNSTWSERERERERERGGGGGRTFWSG